MPPTDDQGNSSQTEQATSGLTAEQLEQITSVVSNIVNKAISSRNKEVEKKFQTTASEIEAKLEQKLSTLSTPAAATSNEPKIEDNPLYKGMLKKYSELQERFEQSEKEKTAERNAARDVRLRQQVADELVKAGVDPSRTRHALALLVDSEKRVKYDDDGEIIFRDLDNQEIDFSTGIRSWTKSDDAKVFMPARGATGSGDRRPVERKTNSNNGNSSIEEVGMNLLSVLKDEGF
jgi:hypothetical protein